MPTPKPRKNSDGSITWRVQFRIDGKVTQESFLNHDGAAEFAKLVERVGGDAARKVLNARYEPTAVPTLREWTHTFLDPTSGLLTGVEDGTRDEYQRMAERSFLIILGDYPVDAIERDDVGRWVNWQEDQPSQHRKGQKIASKTVKGYHSLLSQTMEAAIAKKLRTDNPAYKVRISEGIAREAVFLTNEEFATLLHFIPDRHKRLVLFMASTGCRWGEATAITHGDIEYTSMPAVARITKAYKRGPKGMPVLGPPKSPKSRRAIGLDEAVAKMLWDMRTGDTTRLIFPNQIGRNIRHNKFTRAIWKPAVAKARDHALCAEAGLTPITKEPNIHDLRHSHASWLIAAGTPLPFIQARLGHEKITTTVDTYGHLVPDAHQIMSSTIGATLANAHTVLGIQGTGGQAKELEANVIDVEPLPDAA